MKTKDVAATTVLLSSMVAPTAGADQGHYGYGSHMWGSGGWMGWMMGPVMMIAMIAIVIAVVVLVVKWLSAPGQVSVRPPGQPERTPLDILKERYARGEIDEDEFAERKRILEL